MKLLDRYKHNRVNNNLACGAGNYIAALSWIMVLVIFKSIIVGGNLNSLTVAIGWYSIFVVLLIILTLHTLTGVDKYIVNLNKELNKFGRLSWIILVINEWSSICALLYVIYVIAMGLFSIIQI